MCAYSHPYIMDLEEMNLKLEGSHVEFPRSPIPPPKLQEIIREFTRLEAHCDKARAICSHNIGQIILGKDLLDYCDLQDPPGWNLV
jgi:hypothetical protein